MPLKEPHPLQSDFEFIGRLRDAELEAETIVSDARSAAERALADARIEASENLKKIRTQAAASRLVKIKAAEDEARETLHLAQTQAEEEAGRIGQQTNNQDADIIKEVAERIVDKHAHR